jgi:hypothetical protein
LSVSSHMFLPTVRENSGGSPLLLPGWHAFPLNSQYLNAWHHRLP